MFVPNILFNYALVAYLKIRSNNATAFLFLHSDIVTDD